MQVKIAAVRKEDTSVWLDPESGRMSAGVRKRNRGAADNFRSSSDDDSLNLSDSSGFSASYHQEEIKYKTGKSDVWKKATRKICMVFLFLIVVPSILAVLVLTLIYFYAPCSIDPQPYWLPEPPVFEEGLEPNDLLTKAELLLNGEIDGPESLVLDGDKMYSGTYDGKIVQIAKRKIERTTHLGVEPCGSFETEPTCGRPLGIRMNEQNELIVADAYLGIYKVDIWKNTSTKLVEGGKVVRGRALKFINDLVLLPDGSILFTDSSSTWDRRSHLNIFLESKPDGRLLQFIPATKGIHVLVDGLYFANGVELSLDKKSLFIAETSMARIHRYYLDGPKRGTIELFAQNLPGFPDNIRLSSDGNLWVPFTSRVRSKEAFSLVDYLGDKIWIRKLFSQVVPVKYMHTLIDLLAPKYGLLVQFDQNGRIVKSLHDPTGKGIIHKLRDTCCQVGGYM